MRGGKYLILLLAITALLVGAQTSSHATATLQLTDGITIVTIEDGQAGDANTLPGWVTFVGSLGNYWYGNVTTGKVGPNMAVAYMDLHSVDSSSTSSSPSVKPPDLNIQLTEVGFTGQISSGFSILRCWWVEQPKVRQLLIIG